MAGIKKHVRTTLLAGVFAATPVVVTIFFIWYVESATRQPLRSIGWNIPFLGVVLAVVLIYLMGLIVTSLIGKWLLGRFDALLSRLPVLSELYQAWKHISVTPGGKEGIFGKVVLVPVEGGTSRTIGFTSGDPIEHDPLTCCVFIPAAPNPMNGRLIFLPIADCIPLPITAEEAFKWILSGGNYVPPEVGRAIAELGRCCSNTDLP
jgi:uncharacterized membrane protein